MEKIKLQIEELEERIAPTWVVIPAADGSPPADESGVGPVKDGFPVLGEGDDSVLPDNDNPAEEAGRGAWNAHDHAEDVIDDPK